MENTQITHPDAPRPSRRASDRFASELLVEIGGAMGLTKNVSATGIYLETTVDQVPGSKVHFEVEVVVKGERLKMVCAGEVMRVEHKLGMIGIGIKLTSSFFTDTDHAEDPAEPVDD
jgi:hypothetical protein